VKSLRYASIIFLLTLFLYLRLVPIVMALWKITGDEPHYLLAAHSIVIDHDLDLKNNYINADYSRFYILAYLDMHTKIQPDGKHFLSHDIGLPFLIAPAYWWKEREGVMIFFAFIGALLAAQMFLLAYEVTTKWWAATLAWLTLILSVPITIYVFQIYPEAIGGLIVLWSMRQILRTPNWIAPSRFTLAHIVALAVALSILTWLSARYAPIVLLLLALLITKHFRDRRIIIVIGSSLISLALYIFINVILFKGLTPGGDAVSGGFSNSQAQQITRGLIAWWFDQQRGLLVYAPSLIIALIGLPHLYRLRGRDGITLIAPLALIWILASAWGGFFIAFEITAKFLIVAIPLLIAATAAAFARVRLIFLLPISAALITFSAINTFTIFLNPYLALFDSPVKFYEDATRQQLRQYLPAMGTRYFEFPSQGDEWIARADQVGYVHQSKPIIDLSVGWYKLYAQAQFSNVRDATRSALSFDVFASETGFSLGYGEVKPEGKVDIAIPFFNPYYDKWRFPLLLDIKTTGVADVRLSPILIEPDPVESYKRVAVWGGIILVLVILFAWKRHPPTSTRSV